VFQFERWLGLVPSYSVFSVYSVVLAEEINHGLHRKHGEDTEQKRKVGDCTALNRVI